MLNELSQKLAYQFKNIAYLKTALTHRSAGRDQNERLEFLGDSVVNFVIADMLYQQLPEATEGELSRFRATLVSRDMLAELAKQFDLGRYLILGPGEQRSRGYERSSILSCAMEAVIGAVYCDGGFQVAYDQLRQWYEPQLASLGQASAHKDPKTILQEYLQGQKMALPTYTVTDITGKAHTQGFIVKCEVASIAKTTLGKGTSRRRAEQEAASSMLKVLQL